MAPAEERGPRFSEESSASTMHRLTTLALARAYTARRLAVGWEHLTSADWAAVAAAAPSKTDRQCRHKVEKLCRCLRSNRRRPCPLLDAIDLLDVPSPPFFSKSQSRSTSRSSSPPLQAAVVGCVVSPFPSRILA
ncbi:FRIGIDA interacting protein 2 [Zea mays]|uniref:FRIGIDA interacting protein 2 n=1 Tax=Zea mays TaxID=4577 RepID=A0A1D6I1Y0_MAIZE|nr:FRIGIDA interacting protein 2 [Zea mays]